MLSGSRPGVEGGLRLSYATLGAFMKYPKESLPKKPTTAIADKKYGFFQTDKDFFIDVAQELGQTEVMVCYLQYESWVVVSFDFDFNLHFSN